MNRLSGILLVLVLQGSIFGDFLSTAHYAEEAINQAQPGGTV